MNNILEWDDQIYLMGYYLRHQFRLEYKETEETAFINKVYEILEDEYAITDPKFIGDLLLHLKECFK